ncbi:hypothetical protein [Paenibacillus periandrae]|uniref:hypothetical protein n=1 Tax=Paenibacillus periandrae TaxID=1761741 RepID=UPI001F0912C6|nr:hypothetical protein [Paenibacillus periandrae]
MLIKQELFLTVHNCLNGRGFTKTIPVQEPNLNEVVIIEYLNHKKKVGIAWDGTNDYFIIQKSYVRRPACSTFLIRLNELNSKEELINDMEDILNEWNV